MLITAWTDDLLVTCPRCPVALVTPAVRFAAREFFERSGVHIIQTAKRTITAGTATYDVSTALDASLSLVRIWESYYNETRLVPKTSDWLARTFGDWSVMTGDPAYVLQDSPKTVTFVPSPTTTIVNGIYWRCTVKPARAATTIDDTLGDHYYEAILAGAKSNLMLTKGVPYSDPKTGMYWRKQFDSAINAAMLDARKNFQRVDEVVQLPRYV